MKTLAEINLLPNERAAIQAAAKTLRENLPISQIILFGSKARGDSDEESDIDLLLLTKHRLSMEEESRAIDLIYPIQLEHDAYFGLVDIPEEEWFHGVYQVMPLRHEVDRDGVTV